LSASDDSLQSWRYLTFGILYCIIGPRWLGYLVAEVVEEHHHFHRQAVKIIYTLVVHVHWLPGLVTVQNVGRWLN